MTTICSVSMFSHPVNVTCVTGQGLVGEHVPALGSVALVAVQPVTGTPLRSAVNCRVSEAVLSPKNALLFAAYRLSSENVPVVVAMVTGAYWVKGGNVMKHVRR